MYLQSNSFAHEIAYSLDISQIMWQFRIVFEQLEYAFLLGIVRWVL